MGSLNLGNAVLTITGDPTSLYRAVQGLKNGITRELQGASSGVNDFERSVTRSSDGARTGLNSVQRAGINLGNVSRSLGPIVGGLGFGALATQSIRLAGALEQSAVAFTTLLGDGQKARAFLGELAQFSARTPFEFVGIQKASRQLLAFGFDAENILPIMSRVGDAVAALGGGQFEIDRLIRAFGQLNAKSRLTAEELLQVTEVGIPAYEILSEKLGLTTEQLANVADQGISSSQAISALLAGMADRYGGAMEAQSKTLLGLFSNLKDQAVLLSGEVGTRVAEALNFKGGTQGLIDLTAALRGALSGDLSLLLEQFKKFEGVLTVVAIVAGGVLLSSLGALPAALGAVAVGARTMYAALGGPVTLALAAFYAAYRTNFLGVGDLTNSAVSSVKGYLADLGSSLKARVGDPDELKVRYRIAFGEVSEVVKTANQNVRESLSQLVEGTALADTGVGASLSFMRERWEAAFQFIASLIRNFPAYVVAMIDAQDQLGQATSRIWEGIKNIFQGFRLIVFGFVVEPIQNMVAPITQNLSVLGQRIGNWVSSVAGWFKDLFAGLGERISGGLANAANTSTASVAQSIRGTTNVVRLGLEDFVRNSDKVQEGLTLIEMGWGDVTNGAQDARDAITRATRDAEEKFKTAAAEAEKLAKNTETVNKEADNYNGSGLQNLTGDLKNAADGYGGVADSQDAVKKATEASTAWIQRLQRETDTGLKPAAQTVDLLTEALERQEAEMERLARAGLIDGAQFDIAAEKARLLTDALSEFDQALPEPQIEVEVVGQVTYEMPEPEVVTTQARDIMPKPSSAWTEQYQAQLQATEDLIAAQGRLNEMRMREYEMQDALRYGGEEGILYTIKLYEQAEGSLTSYADAQNRLSAAGMWTADVAALMAERFDTTITSVTQADEAFGSITEKLMSLGSNADPESLKAIREELDGLAASGFSDPAALDSLYAYLGALESLEVAPLQALRAEVQGLFTDQELTKEQLIAVNDILANFDASSADSLAETRTQLEGAGEAAGLTSEQMQVLLDLLDQAAAAEIDFDAAAAEDTLLTLITSLETLIGSTELFGEAGQVAASVVVEGYTAIQEAREATRIAQAAAAAHQRNDSEENRQVMVKTAAASEQAWENATATIAAGVAKVGQAVQGLENETAQMAGKAMEHAGNIAMAFATDPTGVSGAIAIAVAAVDFLVMAFNHAAEAAKRTAEETKKLAEITRDLESYGRSSGAMAMDAELIRLEAAHDSGKINDAQFYDRTRGVKNQQADLDAQSGHAENMSWYGQQYAEIMAATDDPAKQQAGLEALLRENVRRSEAINSRKAAEIARNNAQYQADIQAAAEARKNAPENIPKNSIAGKRESISELRQRQETSTSAGEVQRLQGQIENLEADIQKMLGEEDGAGAKKGSLADLENQISELRKKQSGATSAGQYASAQGQIDKLQDRIAKIKGEAAESIAKGSIDYYEKLIGDLREKQGRSTSQGEYARLQNDIEGYEARVAKIRGDVEKSVAKGTINYYEEQIRLAKEQQGNTKSKGEYAKLQTRIAGYESQISKIRGEGAEGAAKGTIDYYEEQVRALKDRQGKTGDRAQYAKLQGQIDDYEDKIARVKGEVEAGTVKGSIDYYQERIRDLKERQGRTTNKADFGKIQEEINKYERAVADIESGGSDNLKNSIGFYKDVISDLKRRQEDAKTETEFAEYQTQIDHYQAEIDRISGEVDDAYGKGTVGYYEEQISVLREQQKHAKTPRAHAELQSQIEGHQNQIDRIQGEVDAATIKGSVAYFENEISKLREAQKATTTRQGHRELETQIEAFQTKILAITEDAGADAIKGTLGFYEARISALREAQAFAKTPGDYADINNEIAGYQSQIDAIKGLGDLEGSINYYTDLLSKKQAEFDATANATVRAALGAEIGQLEQTLEELRSAGEASQSALDAVRERYKVAAEDFAGTFKSAMQNASDYESFFEGLQGNLRDTVRNAIIEGANSADDFQALSDNVARALADGTVSQGELDALQDQATQIAESRKGVYDLLDDLTLFGESLSESAKGMKGMNAELTNVPSGLKLAEHRYAAAAADAQVAMDARAAPEPPAMPTPPASAVDLSLSAAEMAAQTASDRTTLEAQALYLRQRRDQLKTRGAKGDPAKLAELQEQLAAMTNEVMTEDLDTLYERVGKTLGARGTSWKKRYEDWLKAQEDGQMHIMPFDPEDGQMHIMPFDPEDGQMHIMPFEPKVSIPGKGSGQAFDDPTGLDRKVWDGFNRMPNLETDAMRGALSPGNYGFTPGTDQAAMSGLADRLEKTLQGLGERSGMTFGDVHLHGVQDLRALRNELLDIERGINRSQHGSSVAR